MKRKLSVLLILCMLIPLAACGKKDAANEPASEPVVTEATGSESAAEPTKIPETEPAPESAPESAKGSADASEPVTEPTPATASEASIRDEGLSAIFEEVMNVHPGSAGSSISAAACAVRLLDWGAETELNDDGIRSATEAWLEEQDETSRELFKESIRLVRASCDTVRDKDPEFILSYTGISSGFCPWDDRAFSVLETVFSACGLE